MWLNHEIGRCHLELQEYTDAKLCGDRSLDAARTGDDTMWQINALVLVAQSNGKTTWNPMKLLFLKNPMYKLYGASGNALAKEASIKVHCVFDRV